MKNSCWLYKMVCCFCFGIIIPFTGNAQAPGNTSFAEQQSKITVSGLIVDESGERLIGASVVEKGLETNGTVTDVDGRFNLSVSSGAILVVSYIGFQKLEIAAKKDIRIVLHADVANLDEVVIVAYGVQKKVSVIGSVASISRKDLMRSSSPNLSSALSGKLPGLTTIQTSGEPGRDDVTMFLRGAATTNGTSPLIMVDGVAVDDMRSIDPHEIANISILKDASATAVFGVRGANGVIMITTRRGEKGKGKINANVEFSMQEIAFKPERLDSWEWVRLRNEALVNDGNSSEFDNDDIGKFDSWKNGNPVDPDFYPNNNWQEILFRDFAPMTRVNVNVGGGSDKLQYFISSGYLNQGGMFNVEPESDLGYDAQSTLNRYNFRSNIDYKINHSIKVSLNASSYIEKINGTNTNLPTVFNYALTSRPTSIYLTPEGAYATDAVRIFPIASGLAVEDPANSSLSAYPYLNRSGYQLETKSGINIVGGLDVDLGFITDGLSVKGQISFDSKGMGRTTGTRSFTWYTYQTLADGSHLFLNRSPSLDDEDGPIELKKSSESYWFMNLQAQVNYGRTFADKHNVTAMFLAQRDIKEANATSGDLLLPYNRIGISARGTYDFDRRYFIEGNIGYNGSEQFSPDKRFGFFPAVSAGWLVSNESFLRDNPLFTNLKLRASWGKVGNDAFGITRFLYLDNISQISVTTNTKGDRWLSPSLGYWSDGSGYGEGYKITENYIGNEDITWETAEKQNYGIDITLSHDISFSFDYFIENRKDILLSPQSTPLLQGISSSALPLMNKGKIRNRGYEMVLGYQKQLENGLSLSANVNFSYSKNKVLDYDETLLGEDYAYRTRTTGYSLDQNWGYVVDYSSDMAKGKDGTGFFYSDESIELSGLTYEGVGTPKPGDFIYKDLNNDHIINDRDKAPIGYSSLLPRINYGISLAANWKGFDMSVMFQGVDKYSKTYSGAGIYESSGNFYKMHTQRWTKERYENHEKITYPRLSSSGGPSLQANSFFIMDASYLRLKNAEIGYTLPEALCQKIGFSNVRFYLSGNNLYTWTHLKTDSFDPEQDSPTAYPTMRNYNLGLNITF
jgi:TonB-linked SusC/RagA family outer membrane protein